jgi:hypothetical protein
MADVQQRDARRAGLRYGAKYQWRGSRGNSWSRRIHPDQCHSYPDGNRDPNCGADHDVYRLGDSDFDADADKDRNADPYGNPDRHRECDPNPGGEHFRDTVAHQLEHADRNADSYPDPDAYAYRRGEQDPDGDSHAHQRAADANPDSDAERNRDS